MIKNRLAADKIDGYKNGINEIQCLYDDQKRLIIAPEVLNDKAFESLHKSILDNSELIDYEELKEQKAEEFKQDFQSKVAKVLNANYELVKSVK